MNTAAKNQALVDALLNLPENASEAELNADFVLELFNFLNF